MKHQMMKILTCVVAVVLAFAAQTPEPDEAGFVPRSRGRLEYETLLKSRLEAGAPRVIK